MGAHNFQVAVEGETAEVAYNDAVAQAVYDYGHDRYNGTISTTNGFVMIPFNEGETPDEWAERVIDDPRVSKWENCACVANPTKEGWWMFAGWAAS